MASGRRANSLGVDWHLPDRSGARLATRRFATTTPASSLLIEALAAEGKTWAEIADAILFDDEAKAVATRFIEAGHGERIAALMLA